MSEPSADEHATTAGAAAAVTIAGSVGDVANAPMIGARLGRYLLIDELGRGGMGLVLRAYDPKLQREVALKRLRPAALDASAQARLVREARAMARLSHPNVVAVYDVQTDEVDHDGVVVVMEYVPGATLRAWLRSDRRSVPEITRAFVQAGRGLAAAHAQGLLHRDFKPDNVLVGDDGRVRVTDFGLARATGARASSTDCASIEAAAVDLSAGSDALTEIGIVMGTPMFMAPEQMQSAELDARADQYAFCVSLWHALTGRWPFRGAWAELLEAKRAGVPCWPAELGTPRHVVDALRRGLAPRPDDRFPTLAELLHALEHDPTIRRRRRIVVVGAIGITGILAWGSQRVMNARTHAACAAEGARIDEIWNDARADEIAAAFHATEIPYADDAWARARPRLEGYARAWQQTRIDSCVQAELHDTVTVDLAEATRACLDDHRDELRALLEQLVDPDSAVAQKVVSASASLDPPKSCTDPAQLRQRGEPPSDPELRQGVAAIRSRLADAAAASATGRYEQALAIAQAVHADAVAFSWPPLVAEAGIAVGSANERLGRYEDARDALQLAFFEAEAAGRDVLAMRASKLLVFCVGYHLQKHEDGLHWGRLSQAIAQRLGLTEEVDGAALLGSIGSVHLARADHAEARDLFARAATILERVLGAEHPDFATAIDNLGTAYLGLGDLVAARELHRRALWIRETMLGPEHPQVALSLNNLANVERTSGDHEEAIALYERALAIREATLGPDHPKIAGSLDALGVLHKSRARHAQAQALHDRALKIREAALGPDHPDVAFSLTNLALVRVARGEYDEALALHERALKIREASLGPEHPDVAATLNNVSAVYDARGDTEEALIVLQRALTIWETRFGPEHPQVATALNNIGAVQFGRGEHEEAVTSYQRALTIFEKTFGAEHPDVAMTLENIGSSRYESGEYEASIAAWERALTIRERTNATATRLATTRFLLARALWDADSDRSRARELATRAADALSTEGETQAGALAEIEQWLQAHALP